MKRNESRNDSWSLLISELGIDDPNAPVTKIAEEPEQVEPSQPEPIIASAAVIERTPVRPDDSFDSFGKGLLDDVDAVPEPQPIVQPVSTTTAPLAAQPVESVESSAPSKPREGKKGGFFDRFPKINLFGGTPKESLAAVVEGVKSPSLGGKSFASSKLEKVPVSQERVARREKHKPFELDDAAPIPVAEAAVDVTVDAPKPIAVQPKETAAPEAVAVADPSDPWSQIASQVGSLGGAPQRSVTPSVVKPVEPHEPKRTWDRPGKDDQRNADDTKRRYGRPQRAPSMFDEPATEFDESAALNSLIGQDRREAIEAERRLRSTFEEEIKPSAFDTPDDTVDDTAKPEPKRYPRQREESRGSRYQDRRLDNRPERVERPAGVEPRETVRKKPFAANLDDDFGAEGFGVKADDRRAYPANRESNREPNQRGRRGSRYEPRELQEDTRFSKAERAEREVPPRIRETVTETVSETTWDIEEESKPVERSSRGRRRRETRDPAREPFADAAVPKREPDAFDSDAGSSEDTDFAQLHKSIPSWDDAIGLLIDGNIAKHSQGMGTGARNNKGRR